MKIFLGLAHCYFRSFCVILLVLRLIFLFTSKPYERHMNWGSTVYLSFSSGYSHKNKPWPFSEALYCQIRFFRLHKVKSLILDKYLTFLNI